MEFKRTLTICDLTAGYMRRNYMFGIVLRDSNGNYCSDDSLQNQIDATIVDLEQKAGSRLMPTRVYTPPNPLTPDAEGLVQGVDYDELGDLINWDVIDASNWGNMALKHANIMTIKQIRGVYNNAAIWTVPPAWIKLKRRMGNINVVPSVSSGLSVAMDANGLLLNQQLLMAGLSTNYPNYWAIDYTYGFAEIPKNIADFIMLRASIVILEQFASAYNPGIASRSISLGSIFSESQSYTASAMYSLMSAQIDDYRKRLEEYNEDAILRQLKRVKFYSA